MRTKIKQLFAKSAEYADKKVEIYGWVRTNRAQAQFGFLNVMMDHFLNLYRLFMIQH